MTLSSTTQIVKLHVDNGIQWAWPAVYLCWHNHIAEVNIPLAIVALCVAVLAVRWKHV